VLTHTSQGTPGAVYRYDGSRFAALTSVVDACQARPFRQALAMSILDRAAMTSSVPGHDLEQPTPSLAALFDAPTLGRYASAIKHLALPYGLGWFIQREHGVRLIWHYGQWLQYSALYLKAPDLTLILLANSGGLSEAFPMADDDVMASSFAKAFVRIFIP
jgi:hypothetical protein